MIANRIKYKRNLKIDFANPILIIPNQTSY